LLGRGLWILVLGFILLGGWAASLLVTESGADPSPHTLTEASVMVMIGLLYAVWCLGVLVAYAVRRRRSI
jgi:hypothetical protein